MVSEPRRVGKTFLDGDVVFAGFPKSSLVTRLVQGRGLLVGIFQAEKAKAWVFPAGPVVKNPPPNAADMGSSLVGELRSHMLWDNSKPTHTTGQFPHDSVEILHAAAETQHSQTHSDNNNKRAKGKEKAWNA